MRRESIVDWHEQIQGVSQLPDAVVRLLTEQQDLPPETDAIVTSEVYRIAAEIREIRPRPMVGEANGSEWFLPELDLFPDEAGEAIGSW